LIALRHLVLGIVLTLALALLVAAPARASFAVPPNPPGHYAPRDECSALPGAAPFLAALRSAVQQRDAKALGAMASAQVQLNLGTSPGQQGLREQLASDPALWAELDRLMLLGCAFDEDNGALVMPWFFAQDLGDADPYSTVLALGPSLPLRTRPSRKASVRSRINWQLIHIFEGEQTPPGFASVAVIDSKRRGYMETVHLRSPLDYRLLAQKQDGVWRITYLVAGD
jgi:hypothetical protein